jgi:hypothetical protein
MRKSGNPPWRRYSSMTKFALCSVLVGLSAAAGAQTLTSPGPTLEVMRQIQGAWRSECHPQPTDLGSGFQQIRLQVQFTHFTFTTEEYDEPDCRIKRASSKSRYRFVLREPFLNKAQEQVFAIDFQVEEIPPGVSPVHPQNILSYKSGTLRIGDPKSARPDERLQKLDRSLLFSR